MLTPHCSAASGMIAPASIVSTTRLRKSSEYGFAIHAGLLPVASLNHIRARMGIPDSAFSGNALGEHPLRPSRGPPEPPLPLPLRDLDRLERIRRLRLHSVEQGFYQSGREESGPARFR